LQSAPGDAVVFLTGSRDDGAPAIERWQDQQASLFIAATKKSILNSDMRHNANVST
jgi:hypothetical protein